MESIQYLLHQQVDKKKWDACINTAANGLLYACSGYMDGMAPGWGALVLNDYEMVMPLPGRKKWGINYLFQPSITPELGIFGNGITPAIVAAFLKAIPATFKVWDISLNSHNTITATIGTIIPRNNYVLDITAGYDKLQQQYSENILRNISKAVKSGCIVKKDIPFADVAAICKQEFPKFTRVEDGLFEKLHTVYTTFKDNAASYGVYTQEGQLLASAIFLFFKQKAYYWLVGNTAVSKQYGASPLLLDSFIKDYAGKNLVLDFEGSDTPSVADFYKKFGAVLHGYTTVYLNTLPWPFKLLKPLPGHYRTLISQ